VSIVNHRIVAVVRSLVLLIPFFIGANTQITDRAMASAPAVHVYASVATERTLDLRLRPDQSQKVVATLAPGARVEVIAGPSAQGWYKVDPTEIAGWRSGWARGRGLRFDLFARATSELELYAGASESPSSVATVRAGAVLPVVGPADGEFLLVKYGEVVGYASVPAVELSDEPTGSERWVDVDRTTRKVRLIIGTTVVATFKAALGRDQSDGFYATASGTYRIYSKYRDLSYTPYANAYIKYWAGFDPSRENGFHGWTMDANGRVIPGGSGPTAGCVATRPEDAAVIYDFVEIGTRVEVHW
jgi:hypothetical protein